MSNRFIAILILFVVLMLTASSAIFRVTEIEKVVHLRFGALHNEQLKPGLHIKLPMVDTLVRFDARVLTVDAAPESFYTVQKKRLIVDSFVKWKIVNVGRYYRATSGDQDVANELLSARVNDGLRNEFGVLTLHEVVAGERDQLMKRLTEDLHKSTSEALGIKVIDVRIKRIDLPVDVSESVYRRMRAEREKLAREYRSEGRELAVKIKADADRQKVLIEVDAYKKSEIIRGEGDAQATNLYSKAYTKDAEFYNFSRSLQAYKSSFNSPNDLILIKPDSSFFEYLKDRDGGKK